MSPRRSVPAGLQERAADAAVRPDEAWDEHQIPLKTDRWDVQEPGFTEIDLVAHSGNRAAGDFIYSLNVTDILTMGGNAGGDGQECTTSDSASTARPR